MSIVPADKKLPSALLAIFLGGFGIHKFYYGATGAGLTMLLCTVLGGILGAMTCLPFGLLPGIMWTIGLIEGIVYLTKSDSQFYSEYQILKKSWF